GTRLEYGRSFATLAISARGKAPDGMDLITTQNFEASEPARLPKPDVIQAAVNHAGQKLDDLMRAPVVEPFVGPAILSGSAGGVLFHEIFGHRIERHRQKDGAERQTCTKCLYTTVPRYSFSVI